MLVRNVHHPDVVFRGHCGRRHHLYCVPLGQFVFYILPTPIPDFNQVDEHVDLSSSYYRVCTDLGNIIRLLA